MTPKIVKPIDEEMTERYVQEIDHLFGVIEEDTKLTKDMIRNKINEWSEKHTISITSMAKMIGKRSKKTSYGALFYLLRGNRRY